MKRDKTLSLGEFKQLTKDLPDDTAIMVAMNNYALAVSVYVFETTLDKQGVFLLDVGTKDSVRFVTI